MDEEMLDELSDKFIFMDPYLSESEKKIKKAAIVYIAEELITIEEEKGWQVYKNQLIWSYCRGVSQRSYIPCIKLG